MMERFFLNLKMERVWQKDYANHAEVTNDMADYIVGFYNSIRLHSKLGNLSPNAFERESTSKKSIKLSEITWPLQLIRPCWMTPWSGSISAYRTGYCTAWTPVPARLAVEGRGPAAPAN